MLASLYSLLGFRTFSTGSLNFKLNILAKIQLILSKSHSRLEEVEVYQKK